MIHHSIAPVEFKCKLTITKGLNSKTMKYNLIWISIIGNLHIHAQQNVKIISISFKDCPCVFREIVILIVSLTIMQTSLLILEHEQS